MHQEYDSQEDEDYQPQKKEEREFQNDQLFQTNKKHKKYRTKTNVQQAWEQLKQQTKVKPRVEEAPKTYEQMVALSAKILSNSEIRRQKKVIFAGKQFILDQSTGQMRQIQKQGTMEVEEAKKSDDPQTNQRNALSKQYSYLNHVIYSLQQRYRNINSVNKSKMDWKNFVKKQGIQEKLSYNRKGGALQDVKFIKRTQQKK